MSAKISSKTFLKKILKKKSCLPRESVRKVLIVLIVAKKKSKLKPFEGEGEEETNRKAIKQKSKLAQKQIIQTQGYLDRIYEQCEKNRKNSKFIDSPDLKKKVQFSIIDRIIRKIKLSYLF
jgi:hypothetical protein